MRWTFLLQAVVLQALQRQYLLQKIPCEGELLARIRALPTGQETDSRLLGSFYSIVAELLPRMQYREHSRGRQILEQARQYISAHTDCKVPDRQALPAQRGGPV